MQGKDSVKEFLYQLFTFLITKSQAGNTLIRDLECVFPFKFCFPQKVIYIKKLNNFTLVFLFGLYIPTLSSLCKRKTPTGLQENIFGVN